MLAVDDTIERRWGRRIRARGIYRDPVRSSDAHFVKTSGLRWMSLMLLAPIPWAGRVWALPFLTALAPSERCCRERGRRHKTLIDWARRLALQARRWLPGLDLILVTDSGFAAPLFLDAMRRGGISTITRLRLDAALYEPAPPRPPGTIGRPRTKGARLPTLSEVLRTASLPRRASAPTSRGIRCRSSAGSSNAGRSRSPSRKRGRTWASRPSGSGPTRPIARTTPCLLALFSIVSLLADRLPKRERQRATTAAWYAKPSPTFSDALAAVRRTLWREQAFLTSPRRGKRTKQRPILPEP